MINICIGDKTFNIVACNMAKKEDDVWEVWGTRPADKGILLLSSNEEEARELYDAILYAVEARETLLDIRSLVNV